ncbi:MAG: VCBS repeat-containing protein [Planctomycetes bacterium]|nr:VCBS repeat-containing protein [Planctomycetota bacterium]
MAGTWVGAAYSQSCPQPDPPPLTHAPIQGLDADTVALGQFESDTSLLGPQGSSVVKSTLARSSAGIFSTSALLIPSSAAVGLYASDGFDPAAGTIEAWVKPGPAASHRQYLLSLTGTRSVDGDENLDLIVGETGMTTSPITSFIYFGDQTGLDLGHPATFTSVAPRGMALGDVNGDGEMDLVVAMNHASTLAAPLTPAVPGEVHVFRGPLQKNSHYGAPNTVLEVDLAQGLILAPLDAHPGLDIVVASYDSATPPIYGFSNDGAGGFTPMNFSFFGSTGSAEALASADFNRDGVLDIYFSSLGLDPSAVMLGRLNGGNYEISATSGYFSTLRGEALGGSTADLDGDGWLDIVMARPFSGAGGAGELLVFLNNGDGTFNFDPNASIPTYRPFTVCASEDLNNDGDLDIVVANWGVGATLTDASTIFWGPFAVPLVPVLPTPSLAPPASSYLVANAVSMTAGDLNADGINDLFFHASRGYLSPVFLFDAYGDASGGMNGMGKWQSSYDIVTLPTLANPAGEGAGVHSAATGTSTYGTVVNQYDGFELFLEGGELRFAVLDDAGERHELSAPFPPASDPYAVNGFHHVQAEWSQAAGELELFIGHPAAPAGHAAASGAPFQVSSVDPIFRIGSDGRNQRRASGFELDDFRLSTVRRSSQDRDGDGVPDEWDNCPFVANASQADANGDGVGDSCGFCQQDLGYKGPGSVTLSVCGQPLQAGSLAALRLQCAPPNASFFLFFGLANNPTPFMGGTFVPIPIVGQVVLPTDAQGEFWMPITGISVASAIDVYLQAGMLDGNQPLGVALSNALKLQLLP